RTRKTLRRYTALSRKLGWDPQGSEPDEALAATVGQRLVPVAAGRSIADLPQDSEDLRLRGSVAVRGFRTARSVASRR
ncbi:MAG: hypothetical protein ACFFEW_18440, partial [Candidatus Thorarchaeota archaeon]